MEATEKPSLLLEIKMLLAEIKKERYTPDPNNLLSTKESAAFCDRSTTQIAEWRKKGMLPAVKISGVYYHTVRDLKKIMRGEWS